RRHTRFDCDWSSDVCSSDLAKTHAVQPASKHQFEDRYFQFFQGGEMAHYGTLRDYRFTHIDAATDDIRGSKVYGLNDEKLGKIDDVIFNHSTGEITYVVIDTGGW